jgi:hypothetical protein
MGASANASAQTCAAPVIWQAAEPLTLTVDTCTGELVAGGFCDNSHASPGPVVSVALHYDPACMSITQIAMAGGDAGFHPVVYLSSDVHDCAAGTCLAAGDTSIPLAWVGYPAGNYTLNVTASELDPATACGPVTLSMQGEFPGCADTIFANGFDAIPVASSRSAPLSLKDALDGAMR